MELIEVEPFDFLEDFKGKKEPPKDTRFIISLLLPGLILFAIIILIPIILGIFISFRLDFNFNNPFGQRFTLINYYQLLTYGNVFTRNFWQYTYQTLFFSVVSLALEFLLGLLFATILNKTFKGRGLARATLLIPWAIPTVASATLFKFEIFNNVDQNGLINSLIVLFGGQPIGFFGTGLAPILFKLPVLVPYSPYISEIDITMTMFTAISIDVWKTTPFITLLILAALQIMPEDLNKAGDIAGANGWQKFRYITWPLIKPGVGIALIFRMMQALRVYDAVVVFNDRSVTSMTYYSVILWQNTDFGMASAVSIMILLFIILFALFILIFTRREKRISIKKRRKYYRVLYGFIPIFFIPFFYKRIERFFERRRNRKIIEKDHENDDREKKNDEEEIRSMDNSRKENQQSEGVNLDRTFSDLIGISKKIEPISRAKVKLYVIKRRIGKVVFAFLVIFMCLFCAAPFLWIFLKSFRNPSRAPDIIQTQFELIPKYFSLRSYKIIFQTSSYFGNALINSIILAGTTVLLVLVIGSLIAYAIARFNFPFKKGLNGFIFSMNSLPPLIIIIPFYIWIISIANIFPPLDIRDTLEGLILPYSAVNLPLAVFILIAFFKEIPDDLWKAAKVDGATNFQIFRKIILPLTIPGLFTCAILVFIASWNELLFAQVFLASEKNHTIPLAILQYVRNPGSITVDYNTDIALMAATSIATIPLIIVVLIFQKKIISGLTQGAIKG